MQLASVLVAVEVNNLEYTVAGLGTWGWLMVQIPLLLQ